MLIYSKSKSKKKKKITPEKKNLKKEWQETEARISRMRLPGRRIIRTITPKRSIVDPLLQVLAQHSDRSVSHIPSAPYKPEKSSIQVRYTGEMAERERVAQVEIERKKQQVAPLYNKGGLQYIPNDMDLTTLGKKV